MPHPLLEPTSPAAAARTGLAFGFVAYAVAATVRIAAVADFFVPLSILDGVGTHPLRPFTGGDARVGFTVLVLTLLFAMWFIPLRNGVLVAAVSILAFAASHFVSVMLPNLFLNGVIPLPAVLRTPVTDIYTHPWLRVIVFAALSPLAVAALAFGAPRLLNRPRSPRGPA